MNPWDPQSKRVVTPDGASPSVCAGEVRGGGGVADIQPLVLVPFWLTTDGTRPHTPKLARLSAPSRARARRMTPSSRCA